MRFFGYPYNDLVICKDSPDYLILNYVHKVTFYIISYSMNATETTLLHFYLISMFVLCDECQCTLTLWNPQATTVDSPPFFRPDHGRPESTQEFIIIVYLRLRNRMRYAWTSHSAIDINAHTRIGVCYTYNIAFE